MALPGIKRASPRHPLGADLDQVLAATEGLWEELRGRRLFVTGGTGFFGCWLLESFLHANETLGLGAKAVVLTRDAAAFSRKSPALASSAAVDVVVGDVRSFEFPDGEFSHIVHAATTSSAPEPPVVLLDTIVQGTRRVLEFAARCGTPKLLLCSSGAVYGPQPGDLERITEDFGGAPDPLDAASVYGEGKRIAELLCSVHAREHGIDAKIARCFAFVGPHLPLDAHFAIGNFLRDALAGGPIRIHGDGTPLRSYLYAADLATWLWTILFRGVSGRAYNVGSSESVRIAELATTVASIIDPAMNVRIARKADPTRAPQRYVPCNRRAREELGLQQQVGLEESIRRTVAWHRATGNP